MISGRRMNKEAAFRFGDQPLYSCLHVDSIEENLIPSAGRTGQRRNVPGAMPLSSENGISMKGTAADAAPAKPGINAGTRRESVLESDRKGL